MAAWRLVDGSEPVDDPKDFPTQAIANESESRQELDRLRHLKPGIISFTSPAGDALQIGIGGRMPKDEVYAVLGDHTKTLPQENAPTMFPLENAWTAQIICARLVRR